MKKNTAFNDKSKKKTNAPRHSLVGLIGSGIALSFASTALPQEANAQVRQSASIVLDATTGDILYERNADKKLYPASTTKMMTAYLVFEALENGTLTLDQNMAVSYNAATQPSTNLRMTTSYAAKRADGSYQRNKNGGKIYKTRQNIKTIKVEDALRGMMVRSANDAAVVFGENLGGNRAGFAALMTAKAKELGMEHTSFFNANGLHNSNQYTTAHDMAILLQAIIRDFPAEYDAYFDIPSFRYNGSTYTNTNRLLGSESVPGIDGGKTGYISASGYNIVTSAVRGDDRVITGVFGGASGGARNIEATNLTNFGFYKLTNEPTATYDTSRLYTPADTKVRVAPKVEAVPERPETYPNGPPFSNSNISIKP